MADETVQNFALASSTAGYVVDWLPFCNVDPCSLLYETYSLESVSKLPSILPGMQFKRQATAWKDQYTLLAAKGHALVDDMMVCNSSLLWNYYSISYRRQRVPNLLSRRIFSDPMPQ